MAAVDLSSGLPLEAEQVLEQPPDVPFWSENLLFALYDPGNDIGMWLHLGTVPTDWATWEDRVLVSLPPDQGVLTMWAYHRTAPARWPAGANLAFTCVEPFRRWRVSFHGWCLRTPYAEMRTGVVHDGEKVPLGIDLGIDCVTPVWDAHMAAGQATGRGSMDSQGWATEHYEQLYLVTGTVLLPSGEVAFRGSGWRDHSRGPRGGGTGAPWGGHVILGCVLDSGRAFGLSRYWSPDGTVTLEGGYVVLDGRLQHAEVVDVPRLSGLRHSGETIPVGLRWPGGELRLAATTTTGMWATMGPGLPYGVQPSWAGPVYALNFAACEWAGERGHLYLERSDPLPDASRGDP
jgi:hypothetical protein